MNVMLTSKDASARMRRWQRGGTVTGVIVGLIVGLTVAVWVAMTILKTPLPFVDKISKQSQPAGELGDPNKTMPGGARERRERISEDESVAPAAETVTAPAASTKSAKAAKADPAPAVALPATSPATEKSRLEKTPSSSSAASQGSTSAPATNTANSSNASNVSNASTPTAPASSTAASTSAAAPSTTAAPQPEGFTYYLQAGAFREINDAEATKAKLALMGVAATIAERKSELGTLYRVRVGPFSEIEAMNRARLRLSDNGVDAAVVKVPK